MSHTQHADGQDLGGIANFARGERVACAGATRPEAVAGIKRMGFASIINLRQAGEPGADVDAERTAAASAGLAFFHVPFDGAAPDAAVAASFLEAITSPGAEPAYIHCARGNRAAAMWLIKRIAIDRWPVDRAADEAAALGLTSPALERFAIEYGSSHRR
jgi:uncharacterized protein (TIGR01244 family)